MLVPGMYHSLLRGIGEKEHDNMGHVHKVKLHTALQPLLHRREAFLDKYDAESSRENLHYQNAMRALVPGAWSGETFNDLTTLVTSS